MANFEMLPGAVGIVDRFDEGDALIEMEDAMMRIPTAQLPDGLCEGDVLVYTDHGWMAQPDATARRGEALSSLRRSLLSKEEVTP